MANPKAKAKKQPAKKPKPKQPKQSPAKPAAKLKAKPTPAKPTKASAMPTANAKAKNLKAKPTKSTKLARTAQPMPTKSPARPAAKAKPTKPQPTKPRHDDEDAEGRALFGAEAGGDAVARAIAGDVEAIFEAAGSITDEGERDLMAYRLLAIAADFGSEEAHEALGDMLEASTLRYDDDHGAQGDVHFELALEYLTGTGGLPRDLERGRAHLVEARRCSYPEQIQHGAQRLGDARKRLDAEGLAAFDAIYNGRQVLDDDDDDDDGGGSDDDDDYSA
ncbi:MAG: hypothetical protein KIT31_14975 [Deltaproteobacteria bacterium]|nr:hypothetical protein [Deltaproteobacteria bacterium]